MRNSIALHEQETSCSLKNFPIRYLKKKIQSKEYSRYARIHRHMNDIFFPTYIQVLLHCYLTLINVIIITIVITVELHCLEIQRKICILLLHNKIIYF